MPAEPHECRSWAYTFLARSDLQEQYQGLCSLVQSHAVAAIGLCLAVRAPRTDDGAPPAYRLHTFSIPVFQSVRGSGPAEAPWFCRDQGNG